MQVYLSGGIEYANNFGKDWRKDLSSWLTSTLHHKVFDPTYESLVFFRKNFPNFKREQLKSLSFNEIRNIISKLIDFEISTIINDIDYVICLWDESCALGAGTQGEITVAKYFKKPVYLVTKIDKIKIPSWVIGCSQEIFNDFNDLKQFLQNKYLST